MSNLLGNRRITRLHTRALADDDDELIYSFVVTETIGLKHLINTEIIFYSNQSQLQHYQSSESPKSSFFAALSIIFIGIVIRISLFFVSTSVAHQTGSRSVGTLVISAVSVACRGRRSKDILAWCVVIALVVSRLSSTQRWTSSSRCRSTWIVGQALVNVRRIARLTG